MKQIEVFDAFLKLATGFESSDFIEEKNEVFKQCIIPGLTDLKVVYGLKQSRRVPGSLYPYLLIEANGGSAATLRMKANTVIVNLEIGITNDREGSGLYEIQERADILSAWLLENKYLIVDGENKALNMTDWDINFQYLVNAQRDTIDERYVVFSGGWITGR